MSKDLQEVRGKPQNSVGEGTLGREKSKHEGREMGNVEGPARRRVWK